MEVSFKKEQTPKPYMDVLKSFRNGRLFFADMARDENNNVGVRLFNQSQTEFFFSQTTVGLV